MKKEFYDRLESSLRTYGHEWIRREAAAILRRYEEDGGGA